MSFKYWEYFLSLENDLERCAKFVEFSTDNYESYSNEFAKLIMAASAEFENVAKDLCELISPGSKPGNIEDIYPIIFGHFPQFGTVEVSIPRYKLTLKPWDAWTNSVRPEWWSKGYNKIKHSRTEHFKKANLCNALHAMAGLFTAILYYHHKLSGHITIKFERTPALFDIADDGLNATIITTYTVPT